jgi:hypothetical protein
MKEITKRWNSQTPRFFKKLINIGIGIGIIGGALISFPVTASVGAVLVTVGTTVSAISKLTKQ